MCRQLEQLAKTATVERKKEKRKKKLKSDCKVKKETKKRQVIGHCIRTDIGADECT